MKKILAAMILAGLVAVPMTYAWDDAPAAGGEAKTAKKKNAEHKGGKDAKSKANQKAPASKK